MTCAPDFVPSRRSQRGVAALTLFAVLAPWLAGGMLPSLSQPQSYHDFADQRAWLGIPHALNVVSNLPFLVIGLLGCRLFADSRLAPSPLSARAPWLVMFIGVALTAVGSTLYHLDPSDATLVWDRVPMALGFAGLVAGTLADRAPSAAAPILAALVAVGLASVIAWATYGNLIPYLAMQSSFIAAAMAATATIRSPWPRARWLYGAVALYAAAIVSERLDRPIDTVLDGVASGHTLKHLLAAASAYVIYRMLKARAPISAAEPAKSSLRAV